MKLVDQFSDPNIATAARVRLRIAGIAAHVDTLEPEDIHASKPAETRIGLWVIDAGQHADAVHVLTNPGHKPRRIYDLDEIARLEASVEKKPTPRRPAEIASTLLLTAGLLALIAYTAFEFLRDLN